MSNSKNCYLFFWLAGSGEARLEAGLRFDTRRKISELPNNGLEKLRFKSGSVTGSAPSVRCWAILLSSSLYLTRAEGEPKSGAGIPSVTERINLIRAVVRWLEEWRPKRANVKGIHIIFYRWWDKNHVTNCVTAPPFNHSYSFLGVTPIAKPAGVNWCRCNTY